MALSGVDYKIFTVLRSAGELPPNPTVMEVGESEWYGDIAADALAADIDRLVADPARRGALKEDLARALRAESPHASWDIAKVFYGVFLNYRKLSAIDLHGTPAALQIDLNQPLAFGEQFDVLISIGTAEHVFNVQQFFRNCHALTRPGGLMVYAVPFLGWLDHGFYNFNPTFFWDLAHANGYEVLLLAYTEIDPPIVLPLRTREDIAVQARNNKLGKTANLYALLRKPGIDAEFRVPMQGVYAGTVSGAVMEAWHLLR